MGRGGAGITEFGRYARIPLVAGVQKRDCGALEREQRSGADFFYFDRGDMAHLAADKWSGEVEDHVRAHGGGNMRLAVDKIMLHGLRALEKRGFEVHECAFEYELEAGMVLCVEVLASPESGDLSIKLKDPVPVTEDGFENLTRYPFDAVLMA